MWSRNCLSFRNILVFEQLRNFGISWTFPENSRQPGGFYFYMMFMIPEVLVNFVMKNFLKMFWQRRSKSIKSINSLILKRQKSLRRKAILRRDEKLKYFDGFFKGIGYEYDGNVFVAWVTGARSYIFTSPGMY
jgi:hypothetical protein